MQRRRSADWGVSPRCRRFSERVRRTMTVTDRKIRKLAGAQHAPADWIERARIVALSWDGLGVPGDRGAARLPPQEGAPLAAPVQRSRLDGLGNRPAWGAGSGSPRHSGRPSSRWPLGTARAAGARRSRGAAGCGERARRSDPGFPRRGGPAGRIAGAAVRCGGSYWPGRCAGGVSAAGQQAPTRSPPQKDPAPWSSIPPRRRAPR